MQLFYIPCPNIKVAKKISQTLLEEKWIACSNIIPSVLSMYWWNNKVTSSREVILIIKTQMKLSKCKSLKNKIESLHPYSVPCILELAPISINHAYQKWIQESLK